VWEDWCLFGFLCIVHPSLYLIFFVPPPCFSLSHIVLNLQSQYARHCMLYLHEDFLLGPFPPRSKHPHDCWSSGFGSLTEIDHQMEAQRSGLAVQPLGCTVLLDRIMTKWRKKDDRAKKARRRGLFLQIAKNEGGRGGGAGVDRTTYRPLSLDKDGYIQEAENRVFVRRGRQVVAVCILSPLSSRRVAQG